jgi:alpha-L-rhamnosidase
MRMKIQTTTRYRRLLTGLALWFCLSTPVLFAATFQSAQPIWPENRHLEKNLQVGFQAQFVTPENPTAYLRLTGATLYRVFLNGEFLAHGPARGPHGFYRVDELDLSDKLQPGTNTLAIEVAGYNANSYYLLDQPSFLQAEIIANGKILASTAGEGSPWVAKVLAERVQKTQRYSFQRPFSEIWRHTPASDAWRTQAIASDAKVNCAVQPPKSLLPRRVPYPRYSVRQPSLITATGTMQTGAKVKQPWKDRSLTGVGPQLGGYPESDLASIPTLELQSITNSILATKNLLYSPSQKATLKSGEFQIMDFGVNLTGFPGIQVTCHNPTRLLVTFDEILSGGDVDFKRLGCVNIVEWDLQPGTYQLEAFEPYTLRYLKIFAAEGDCELGRITLREYVHPLADATFAASDERFNRLYAAGRETFRQNAVDIFMDCPSRERAGWLCDSYFTARVAPDLCGDTRIEKNFIENFLLPKKFDHLPEGMLPMCYPADHNDGVFIPNWSLWFVVELEEYLARGGDRELVNALRPRVLRLFEFFRGFKNSDGLLEKLPSWVFVEWSKANDFVQDVNFPSNMLFARALEAAGKLYQLPEFLDEAAKIRETIRRQSFDGQFFVDNAVRKDGKLEVTRNRTEVCQYFAFYFDVATPETHAKLWQMLTRDFGPQRKQIKAHLDVYPANAFIGNVLRLELLSRYGLCQQLLDESLAYQLYMADLTGTLWENDGAYASCNHGFASHSGVHSLYRDVLGLHTVDTVGKTVRLRFTDLLLDWCEGSIPTADGPVALRWRKADKTIRYQLVVPAGYDLKVDNLSKLELVREP